MPSNMLRERVATLARQHVAEGDFTGWFDEVYQRADGDMAAVPWAKGEPNEWLVRWLAEQSLSAGGRTLVSGCGLGDDAEALAAFGHEVMAFDVSAKSIAWCKGRFPGTPVHYLEADLFAPKSAWRGRFDLVYDGYTLQSLPQQVRRAALEQLACMAAPGGRLLLICLARADGRASSGPPWPLSRQDLAYLEERGLALNRFEDFTVGGASGQRRFIAEYQLPVSTTLPAPPLGT